MNNQHKDSPLQLLGSKVKQRRIKLALSQEKLAGVCGFDRTYISLIERGKRNISFINLLILSKGLQISIDKLTKDIQCH